MVRGQHPVLQEPVVGGPGGVVHLVDPGPVSGLVLELHGGLKEVTVEAGQAIDPVELLQGSPGGVAVIPDEPAHHRPVLLLHVGAVVLLVRPGAGEGDALPLAVGIEVPQR